MSDETLSADELATIRKYANKPGLELCTASGLHGTVGDRRTVIRLLDHIAALEAERDAAYARGLEDAAKATDDYLARMDIAAAIRELAQSPNQKPHAEGET